MKTKILLTTLVLSICYVLSHAQCSANFNYTINSNGSVTFTSPFNNVASTNYVWMFGNGTSASFYGVNTATVNYTSAGTYTVCLYVTDTSGTCADSSCQSITIGTIAACSGQPIAGNALASNSSPAIGSNVTLSLSNAQPAGVTYQWQRGISANGPYLNIVNATGATYSEISTSAHCFRCIVNCTSSGLSDASTVACVTPVSATTCNANFVTNINAAGTITCTSTGSNAIYAQYSWNVSNGLVASGSSTNLNITTPGVYTICLSVVDTVNNCSDSSCQSITIPPTSGSCNASFTSIYNASLAQLNVQADTTGNTSSSTYTWYTNNSLAGNGSNMNINLNAGTYTICLIVNDSLNACIDSSCSVVTIPPSASCVANFYIYPDSMGAPHTYIGVNNSINTSNQYLWNWGDGTTSTGQYPSHTYATTGNYTICLMVGTPGTTCNDTMCLNATINKTMTMGYVYFVNPLSTNNLSSSIAQVYPNPTLDILHLTGISHQLYTYQISSLTGEIIQTGKFEGATNINLSEFQQALYLLKISDYQGHTSLQKIIKQ